MPKFKQWWIINYLSLYKSAQIAKEGIVWYCIRIILYGIVLYYIASLNSRRPTEALSIRLAPKERQVLKRDKDVERLENKKEE